MLLDSEQWYKLFHEKNSVQRKLARGTFEFWQRMGFHVVADHFYDPLPNTRNVRETYRMEPRELPGLSVDWLTFEEEACRLMSSHADEYLANRESFGYDERNYYFRGIDALYYYSFLREYQPRRIVEIGQGSSTRLALAALSQNSRTSHPAPELISVDPYARLSEQVECAVQFSIVKKPLQHIANNLPEMLCAGDLLFIDSTHVFKFGSDVQLLFELVYPRLPAGVRLHIHDIYTPYDYPLELVTKLFWNEQYFLESFLSFNDAFQVTAPMHYLARQNEVRQLLAKRQSGPDSIRPEAASFYLLKTK